MVGVVSKASNAAKQKRLRKRKLRSRFYSAPFVFLGFETADAPLPRVESVEPVMVSNVSPRVTISTHE